ncbi:MAG: HAD-IA family hydrolase [Elusimicrobia bacterium]|nr:HAD-IA family hydrolase [Elusimicrobiota bacterium]
MKAARAVIFDLDGTLLDTLADIALCVNRIRFELGLPPHRRRDYRRFVGDGLRELLIRALPAAALKGPGLAARARRFEELYARHGLDRTRPYPGVAGLLDGLVRRGLRMAVVSNKPQRFTSLCVRRLLPRWRFDAVRGARPATPLKPHPAGPLAAARAMRTAPGEVLYLGDAGVDMLAARNAGMFPIGALWGFRGAAELRRCGAAALVRRPADLLELL